MSSKGYLLGERAMPSLLAAELYAAGWTEPVNLWRMLAIILAESDGRLEAIAFNLVTVGSRGAGAKVLEWDSNVAAHPPAIGAPFDYEALPARRLLTVSNPQAGQCRTEDGTLAQVAPMALVAGTIDVGVGQRNLPAEAYRTEREATLRQLRPNLAECRRVWNDQGIDAWAAKARALDPRSAERFGHRAARGIGNWLGHRASLTPDPLLDFRA